MMAGMLTGARWRTIPDWDAFEVSDQGGIRRRPGTERCPSGRLLKTHINDKGYPTAHLRQDGREKQMPVHIAAMLAFVGPPPSPEHEAAHWDGKADNAALENLRWATHVENEADKIRHGTKLAGDHHPSTRISQADIAKIRELRTACVPYKRVAEIVGCSAAQACRIINGQRRAA